MATELNADGVRGRKLGCACVCTDVVTGVSAHRRFATPSLVADAVQLGSDRRVRRNREIHP
jgi:hypothetical protein